MISDEFYTRRNSVRLAGFDYSSKRSNFVTIVAHERVPHFSNPQIARAVIDALLELHEKFRFRLYACCLMPDHFHALIGTGETGLTTGDICGRFKSLSTRYF